MCVCSFFRQQEAFVDRDYNQTLAARPDHATTACEFSDPVESALETTARLRVLERLLQRTLAPDTAADERCALLRRYNGQRRELFARIEGAPADHIQPTPGQLQELIAGSLAQDSDDAVINDAVVGIHRMIDLLGIY